MAREIVISHHERWDGTGYPNRLAGTDIPLSGRLMAIADVYDALRSKRVYKPAMTHEQAKAMILKGKGAQFDPDVVDAFLECADQFEEIATTFKDQDVEEVVAPKIETEVFAPNAFALA